MSRARPGAERQGVAMRMPTTYPFPLPDALVSRLPAPAADGRCYIDVKVRGAWDGILVVDAHGSCVGIHVRRRVEELPLPFEPSEIEDVRSPCVWNRALAQLPFSLWSASLLTVFIVSPALLLMSRTLLSPLAGVSAAASLLAIYLLYQSPGFPIIRPLVALVGLAQFIVGALWFVSSVLR
jgi:hypothetical protein